MANRGTIVVVEDEWIVARDIQLTLQAVPTCACLWGDRVTLRLDRQAAQDQIVNALTRRLSFNVKIKHLDAIGGGRRLLQHQQELQQAGLAGAVWSEECSDRC